MRLFTLSGRIVTGLVFSALFISFTLQADPVKLNNSSNDIRISQNTDLSFTVNYSLSEFSTMDVKTRKGIFTRIVVPTYSKTGEYGTPELPVKSELIEIPLGAEVVFNVISYDLKECSLKDLGINYPLMPNQPPVPKTGEPVEFIYHKSAYKLNDYSPIQLTSVDDLGMMRGVRIGRLNITPVSYNPVTGMIRVYENLVFEVEFKNADLQATDQMRQTYSNMYFDGVYRSLFNYREAENANRENMTKYPIKYVIVADPMFETQLQPFIQWKIKKGFTVVEAYTSDPNVGTTTSQIKSYLQDLYDSATPDDPAPSFVLFVGDIDQVPTFTGQAASHVTDLYYCEYTGDYFPEVFYGRFSAQNTSQLQPQIDKTLMVEQYTMPVTSYLDTVVMIAGMDPTYGPIHANGQINYGTENYFNEAHGIYSHTYLYPESGNNADNIHQNVSDGVAFANYTAHGSPDGWADPSFSVSDVAGLQNNGKYGLLVGNCCSTSEYQVSECFGEALLRAANKGSVGYIGASNSSYWDEDYYFGIGVGAISGDPPSYEETTLGFYDRLFHDHSEPFLEWYTTNDQIIYAGNLAVTEGSPSMAEYYWEAYNLMGDPSLMIYFTEPPALPATYEPLLPLGSATFTVNTVPHAYVGLSMNGVNLGAALADEDGVAVVELLTTPQPGNADVVVTAQNYQPFIGIVLIANPEGPYVMLNQYIVNDINGNGNGVAEYGENILLDVELKNWGSGDAVNANATLSTEDQYVTISDDNQDYGTIPVEDSIMQASAYRFQVADYVPDMHVVPFTLNIQDDTRGSWGSAFSVIVYAPVMAIGNMTIDDTQSGNGNFRLDPGETANVVVNCQNTGHCDAFNVLVTLGSVSPYITLNNTTTTFGTIAWNGSEQAIFSITLANDVPAGTPVDLTVNQTFGAYADVKTFNVPVGLVIEDFESGGFTTFNWYFQGTLPWTITQENVYDGVYSARSGVITDSQNSILLIDMAVSIDDSISFFRKVSCEDDPYNDDYDWLGFFIDGTEVARWDGETPWGRVAFPVTAGTHTFEWDYNKDYSVSAGMDAAWVDNIVFPAAAPAVGVNDKPAAGNADFYILPNPAKDQANIFVSLEKNSSVLVTVYDLAGTKVMDAFSGKMQAGSVKIALNTSALSQGVYFCVLTVNGQKITKKLIIN